MRTTTLVEVLQSRALERGAKAAFTYLSDDEAVERTVTFGDLDRMARGVAAQMQEAGARGKRVLLLYPPGIEFVTAFLGCLYAGSIAVPSYPPNPSRADRSSASRLASIIRDSTPVFALTTPALETRAQALCDEWTGDGSVRCLVLSSEAGRYADAWAMPDIDTDSVAFLQYTSGSTGTPKGVRVTHANVLHNLKSISAAVGITEHDIGVNWLPPYHDMGLIGGLIQPVYEGTSVVLMSPVSFLQRPFRWLSTISRVRATISGGPDFAYDLCVRRITPEQKDQLDLSRWRAAMNGAEPIRPATLSAFTEAFAPCGFSALAWSPCYGLAESTLFVCGGLRPDTPLSRRFESEALERGLAVEIRDAVSNSRELASSGSPGDETRIEIVHPTAHTLCPPGTVGEIWVQGPSVALGDRKRDGLEETFHTFLPGENGKHFLRTGDLGFLIADELFVTGRLQDIIVVDGRTLYPQHIEDTAQTSHPALRRGASAAFGIETDEKTRLIVLCEVERQALKGLDAESVIRAVRQRVIQEHGVEPDAVCLLKTATLPKTSSGKTQRHVCRDLYSTGGLDVLGAG